MSRNDVLMAVSPPGRGELHGRYLPTNGHLAATADRLQAALGDDFDAALTDGAALSWPDAVAYAQRVA